MRGLVHIKEVRQKRGKKDFLLVFSFLNGQQSFDIFVSRPQELKAGVQAEEEQTFREISTVDN